LHVHNSRELNKEIIIRLNNLKLRSHAISFS